MRIRIRAATLLATTAILGTALLGGAPGASATDLGGDGNPSHCLNAYTVASATIYDYNGAKVGLLELRWSASCSGNWARLTSGIGVQVLFAGIQYDPDIRIYASAVDLAAANFSPYMIVPASQRMCAVGNIRVDEAHQYSATVCSN